MSGGITLALPVLKAVFAIDGQWIDAWKQPAFCLGEVQVDGSGLTTRDQQSSDVLHMRSRLMVLLKLFKRDQRRR